MSEPTYLCPRSAQQSLVTLRIGTPQFRTVPYGGVPTATAQARIGQTTTTSHALVPTTISPVPFRLRVIGRLVRNKIWPLVLARTRQQLPPSPFLCLVPPSAHSYSLARFRARTARVSVTSWRRAGRGTWPLRGGRKTS